MKSTFQFKVNTSNEIYTAREEGDTFVVYVADTFRLFSLPPEEVAQYVGEGTWQIIEGDNVNHPNHYQGKTEVIDIIEQATTELNGFHAYCLGNVIKYVMRHQKKGGIEDLKKASWYLNKVIGGERE